MKTLIIFFLTIVSMSANASDCDGLGVAKILNSLTDVGRFHHCALEVLKIDSKDETGLELVSFLVYGRDLFRCKTTDKCPEANFELTLKKECMSKPILLSSVEKNSNGYNLDGRMMRNHIQINLNQHNEPIHISFGQTDLANAKRINFVDCKLNPLGN